jgi:hypothetical protein
VRARRCAALDFCRNCLLVRIKHLTLAPHGSCPIVCCYHIPSRYLETLDLELSETTYFSLSLRAVDDPPLDFRVL